MPTVFVNGPLSPKKQERISTLTSATGLTAANLLNQEGATGAISNRQHRVQEVLITVEAADIRWTCTGTAPTTTATTAVGHLAVAGDSICLTGYEAIANFKAINAVNASGSIIAVTYFFT